MEIPKSSGRARRALNNAGHQISLFSCLDSIEDRPQALYWKQDDVFRMTTKWKLELLFLFMLLDMRSPAQVDSPPIAHLFENILYVDGVKYLTVQAAINALPRSGG